jgi:hypothetical protein
MYKLKLLLYTIVLSQMLVLSTAKAESNIPVNEAGIVILQAYLPVLSNRLGLVASGVFVSLEAQEKCVAVSSFLVTGAIVREELLSLSKLLCGFHPKDSVNLNLRLTDDDVRIIEGLISAAITQWPAIGNSSIAGFRGNWLVRTGILTEFEDYWTLLVDKRAYDVLLSRSPFGFNIIKFPWMSKPLKVNWI